MCGIGRGGISVKRVVGVPGDDVRVGPAGVMVGGTAAVVAGSRPPDLTRDFGRVPDGSVLLIGDDAPESCDAVRWPQPFIPHANLIGRVEGIVAPRDHAGLLRTGGGVDRRMPAGVQRARLDALVDLGRGARAFAVGLTTPHVCSIIVAGDCRTRLARTLADIVRQERGRLRIRLRELAGDCSIAPLRALRRDLGRDHRALVAPGRPLRHVVRAVGVHRSRAAVGVAGCWGATAGPVVGLLR